jgi:hypothetical protein
LFLFSLKVLTETLQERVPPSVTYDSCAVRSDDELMAYWTQRTQPPARYLQIPVQSILRKAPTMILCPINILYQMHQRK